MRKASMAERVLSLATTPERAAVIVGDLVELGAPVWLNVIRTTVSLMLRDARSSPGTVLWTGSMIFLRQFIAAFLVTVSNIFAFKMLGLRAMPGILIYVAICKLLFATSQFLLGRELRRNARQHALAACLVVVVLNVVVTVVVTSASTYYRGISQRYVLQSVVWSLINWQIPMLMGMLVSKPKQSASTQPR
jgi:hypothetical protein